MQMTHTLWLFQHGFALKGWNHFRGPKIWGEMERWALRASWLLNARANSSARLCATPASGKLQGPFLKRVFHTEH